MDFTADEYARRDADRLREILAGPPVTWVFLGDSITQGVAHTHGHRGYVEHFAERVRGELGRRGDAVINSGVSGATTEDLLPEFHWRAGRFAPDVVFVMFGTNDILAGEDGVRGFRYRLDQIWQGLYQQYSAPEDMTNLPKALRVKLADPPIETVRAVGYVFDAA